MGVSENWIPIYSIYIVLLGKNLGASFVYNLFSFTIIYLCVSSVGRSIFFNEPVGYRMVSPNELPADAPRLSLF